MTDYTLGSTGALRQVPFEDRAEPVAQAIEGGAFDQVGAKNYTTFKKAERKKPVTRLGMM